MKYYNKSALGEYVHLYTENYLKYGVSRKWHKAEQYTGLNANNFLKNRVQNIKTVNQNTLDILKQRLEKESPVQVGKDREKLNLDYQARVDEIFNLATENASQKLVGYFHGTQMRNKANPLTPSFDWAIYKERALTDEELLQKRKKLYDLSNDIDEFLTYEYLPYEKVREFIDRYQEATGREDFSMRGDPSIRSSLGRLQYEINRNFFGKTRTEIIGYFGEAWVASASDQVQIISRKELVNAIRQEMVGDEGSSFYIAPEELPMDLDITLTQMGHNKNLYKTRFSKNKVDVQMIVNNQDILANVKTYYNASQVTLQSKVNLLDSLVYLEQMGKFGTHWLNMHAGTLKGNNRKEVDKILEKEIGYEALVIGNPLKKDQNSANVFVHLNRATGKVEVKSTEDLLINSFSRFKINPRIEEIVLKNDYQPAGPNSRIAQLLLNTHQTIISVSLAGSVS